MKDSSSLSIKVSKKMIFFHEKKIVGSVLKLSAKVLFSLDTYQLKIWVETEFSIAICRPKILFLAIFDPAVLDC